MNLSRPILSQSRGQFTYYPEFNNGNLLLAIKYKYLLIFICPILIVLKHAFRIQSNIPKFTGL